jgi:hypothetical protein
MTPIHALQHPIKQLPRYYLAQAVISQRGRTVEERSFWTIEYMGVTFYDATYVKGVFYHYNVHGELVAFADQDKVRVLQGPHQNRKFNRQGEK